MECKNCNKAGHLAKICASHIFSSLTTEQQLRRKMVANIIEQGENSSDEEEQQAAALAVSRHVRNGSPVYIDADYPSQACVHFGWTARPDSRLSQGERSLKTYMGK